jgi:hypothetical protein
MKDGSEVDIKLTVKEIIFANELGGMNKCYGVRVINDDFVKIASKVNSNMKFEVNSKKVNLSNLLNEPTSIATQTQVIQDSEPSTIEENISLNYEEQKSHEEEKINFDFPPVDELKNSIESDLPSIQEKEEFSDESENKLNFDFDENEIEEQQRTITIDLSTKSNVENNIQEESESDYNPDLSFLKIDNDVATSQTVPNEEPQETSHNLDFLKFDASDEDKKVQDSEIDFLKIESNDKSDEISSLQSKDEVIAQIKSDLVEIESDEIENKVGSKSNDKEYIVKSGDFIRKVFDKEEEKSF